MKKYNFFAAAITVIACALWMTSCEKDDLDNLTPKYQDEVANEDSLETRGSTLVSAPNSLFGTPINILVQEWWKSAMNLDCNGNSLNTGAVVTGATAQYGSVIFLADPSKGLTTKFVSMTRKNALLVPVISYLKNDPCPGVIITPVPGEAIFKVLTDGVDAYIDQATALQVTLDGKPIAITEANRVATDLFYFTGNKELFNCLGSCVTGELQPAASDGYWVALPYLSRGRHQLRIHSEIPQHSIVNDVTYHITVR